MIKIQPKSNAIQKNIAVVLDDQKKLPDYLKKLDEEGFISKILESSLEKDGDTKLLHTPHNNIILIRSKCYREAGAKCYQICKSAKISEVQVSLEDRLAPYFAYGMKLGSYSFKKYKSEKDSHDFHVNIEVSDPETTKSNFTRMEAIADAVNITRDFVSEPPNILYPDSYAKKIEEIFEDNNITLEILNESDMRDLGMNALLGVGQGSSRESKMVIMHYKNAETDPIAIVGKGVTFDTGGISIKPSNGMEDMKYDMAGSAAVVGIIYALMKRQAKVNVVGIIGLVENMPGGNAQRPSDVVKSMSGKTIEVLNTDAEGRLVLADALWYAQEKFNPQLIIDIATLTGAITVALGTTYAGLFSNNDEVSQKMITAGNDVGEKFWRMPLDKEYDKMIKSEIADVANISTSGRGAGSSTAAQFLQHFIKNNLPWIHLDIAGMAWEKVGKPLNPKGAVGFGVQSIERFISQNYE